MTDPRFAHQGHEGAVAVLFKTEPELAYEAKAKKCDLLARLEHSHSVSVKSL
jgi:hypothetical protein